MNLKKISVINSLVITLLLSSLSFAQEPIDPPMPPHAPNMKMMHKKDRMHKRGNMFKKLNLTDAQKTKFQKLNFSFQRQMIDLKANLQKNVLDIKEIKQSDNIRRSDVIKTVKRVNASKNAIALAEANHKMDMYEVLTPEQRKIWKKMEMHKKYGKKMMKRNKIRKIKDRKRK